MGSLQRTTPPPNLIWQTTDLHSTSVVAQLLCLCMAAKSLLFTRQDFDVQTNNLTISFWELMQLAFFVRGADRLIVARLRSSARP